ncbi:NIPSNAP family protein [Scytonema sp. PRP1]|uniref:NIPSNAP family protein n=1 Tax=Scytonema sp. PRP1 TaxID=3120513 RepID=UPI003FA75A51
MWEKHGIRQAGFWTTLIGQSNQRLTYMLAWDSMAEREERWVHSSPTPSGSRLAPKPRRTVNLCRTSAASCWHRPPFPGVK